MKKININSDDMIKVWFSLPEADWHNNKSESIWCKVISGQVIVDNIPLFAYKISYGDSIKYILDEDSLPIFNSVVKKSGNSTYRVISFDHFGDKQFNGFLDKLKKIGCSYEGNGEFLASINVPKSVSVDDVYDILQEGCKEGVWDFEESDFNHDSTDCALKGS